MRERGSRSRESQAKSCISLLVLSLFRRDRALGHQTLLSSESTQSKFSLPTRDEGTLATRDDVRCDSDPADDTWSDDADAADGLDEAAASVPVLDGFCSLPALPGLCCCEPDAAAAAAAAAAVSSSLPDILGGAKRKKKTKRERETAADAPDLAREKRKKLFLFLLFLRPCCAFCAHGDTESALPLSSSQKKRV